jgi:hypothetical protein
MARFSEKVRGGGRNSDSIVPHPLFSAGKLEATRCPPGSPKAEESGRNQGLLIGVEWQGQAKRRVLGGSGGGLLVGDRKAAPIGRSKRRNYRG